MHSQLSLWAFEIITGNINIFSSLVFNKSDFCVHAKGFGTCSVQVKGVYG